MYYTIGGFTLDETVLPNGEVRSKAPGGNVLFDRHIRITESDKAYFIALLSKNSKLLGLTRGALGFVITTKPFIAIGYAHFFLRL